VNETEINSGTADTSIPQHLGPDETGLEADSPQLLSDPVAYFTSGYRKHGAIFTTRYRGAHWVTIAGIQANDFFWQNTSDWSYGEAGAGFRDQFGPTYLTQLDGAPHLRKRKLLKPAFSAEAVGRFVEVMSSRAAAFLDERGAWSNDANEWIPALLLSLNKATLLKTEMNQDVMRDAIKLEGELIFGVGVSSEPAPHFARPHYQDLKKRVYSFIAAVLGERLAGKRADDNLQSLLDQNPGNQEGLTDLEMQNDAYMLLVAGIHNTATLITRLLERLSLDPAWVEQLRTELSGYAQGSLSRGMSAFPKLRATILEGERLHPGGSFLKRSPIADLEFSGKLIPAGSRVMQAHTLPHFLPEYYSDPMEFRPMRWLEGEPPHRKALADFGGGAHICIGMNLTRIQVPIVLAEIIRRFDWEVGYPTSFRPMVSAGRFMNESPEPITLIPRP
jgi:cytochrome P450